VAELFTVGELKAVALDGAIHRAAVQALLERGADYARLVEGQDPGPDAARELFTDGPPGHPLEDKFVIGLFDPPDALIAVLEGMRDYPDPGVWWIGLMLLDPAWRGRGLGAQLYRAFEAYAGEGGATALGLGVVEANAGARRFWERVGFAATRVTEPRRFGAREHAVIVMRRALVDRR
jgi:GNAT superfamily N-acetyltransferase